MNLHRNRPSKSNRLLPKLSTIVELRIYNPVRPRSEVENIGVSLALEHHEAVVDLAVGHNVEYEILGQILVAI